MALDDAPTRPESNRSTFGRLTRASLTFQVVTAVVLALVGAVLAITVAEQPGLRLRFDATQARRNSLDPLTVDLLRELDEELRVELFFEPQPGLLGPMREAQGSTRDLLRVMESYIPGKLQVDDYDLTGSGRLDATRRMNELGLRQSQQIVVSLGERRATLSMAGDLASFSSGDPRRGVPPSMSDFRGEQAVGEALMRLTSSGTPVLFFATGHEEYAVEAFVDESGQRSLLSVAEAVADLANEGFEFGLWDSRVDGPVPSDCDVLAIVGPRLPYTEEEAAEVQAFLDRGGRLLVAVESGLLTAQGDASGYDALGRLLAKYGLTVARGIVNAPLRGGEGARDCAALLIGASDLSSSHPITESLRERDRRLALDWARAFDPRGPAPFDGSLLDLIVSPDGSWLDTPANVGGELRYNHIHDPGLEQRGVVSLAVAAEIEVPASEVDARLVAIGSPTLIGDQFHAYNRDFVRNTFNWLTDRDVRLRVSRRDPFESTIDVGRGAEIQPITYFSLLVLPGLCVLTGLFTVWRRRREA